MRAWLDAFLIRQGGALKLLLIGVLTLALLIPLAMVEGVIHERSFRHDAVLRDIAAQHGGEQRLIGPFLAVPYVSETVIDEVDDDAGETKTRRLRKPGVALVLPQELAVRGRLAHDVRRRGVYTAPVYAADIELDGGFAAPDLAGVVPDLVSVDWTKAALVLGVGDLAGVTGASDIAVDGRTVAFESGPPAFAGGLFAKAAGGAIHAPLGLAAGAEPRFAFKAALGLNGSGGLFLTPVAGSSALSIVGDWPHPSFQGAPLPAERAVTAEGFSARWNVPALARGYGAVWHGDQARRLLADAAAHAVGFRHARPDDFYVAATRAAKYGVLFTALTFLACFVLERFGGRALHPAQYGLVGLSLALFYLLLIALAERIGLTAAYGAAAAAIVAMNVCYVGAALRSLRRGAGAGLALALLYAAFYVMLASEDDALLIGSGLLLAGLALAMAATARLTGRAPVQDRGPPPLSADGPAT